MAKCNFTIGFIGPILPLIEKAKSGITLNGGSFEGNTDKGVYTIPTPLGTITGSYLVHEHSIAFLITDKPFLLSCAKIEDELRKRLGASKVV